MKNKQDSASTEAVTKVTSLDELSSSSHSDSSSDSCSSMSSNITAPPVSPITSEEDLSPASCRVTSEDMSDDDNVSGASSGAHVFAQY